MNNWWWRNQPNVRRNVARSESTLHFELEGSAVEARHLENESQERESNQTSNRKERG